MNTEKTELRRSLKQVRLEMSDAERTIKSRAIVERLKQAIDWPGVKTLHYFEPIKQLLEVEISGLIVYLEDNYPDLKLFTPRLIGDTWQLVAARGGTPPSEFDVVIVPMLGFDNNLQRIGYGGGYYDKLLATQPKAKKIGVCFENGKIENIPADAHDIPLNMVITESAAYEGAKVT